MNQSQKKTVATISGLLLVSAGLFGYQNFLMPAQQQASKVPVYIAAEDVPADTVITKEMFKEVSISEDSSLEGSVVNIDEVVGSEVEGGLLKGEQLFLQRLTSDVSEEGNLYVKVEPDFPIDIRDGENVRVFLQGNTNTGESAVVELFNQKKVFSSSRVTSIAEGDSVEGYYMRMTDEELNEYYSAKTKGSIIMAKISTTDGDVTKEVKTSTGVDVNDLKDKTDKSDESSDENNLRYEVKEGDSIESIAHDLEISKEKLQSMNENVETVKAGDFINIPAE